MLEQGQTTDQQAVADSSLLHRLSCCVKVVGISCFHMMAVKTVLPRGPHDSEEVNAEVVED